MTILLNNHIYTPIIEMREREKERERETADPDRGLNGEEIGLREEDLASVDAELPNLHLRQLHLFPTFPFQEAPDNVIQHARIHHTLHCHHFLSLSLRFQQIAPTTKKVVIYSCVWRSEYRYDSIGLRLFWVEREMRDHDHNND